MPDAKAYPVAKADSDRFVDIVNSLVEQASVDQVVNWGILESAAFLVAKKADEEGVSPDEVIRQFSARVYSNFVDLGSGGNVQ